MNLENLVVSTPLKNMKVNWDDDIPNIWKNNKCSNPPTSICVLQHFSIWFCTLMLPQQPDWLTPAIIISTKSDFGTLTYFNTYVYIYIILFIIH